MQGLQREWNGRASPNRGFNGRDLEVPPSVLMSPQANLATVVRRADIRTFVSLNQNPGGQTGR